MEVVTKNFANDILANSTCGRKNNNEMCIDGLNISKNSINVYINKETSELNIIE